MHRAATLVITLLALQPVVLAGGGGVAHKADGRPIRLFHPTPSPKGTILMFHGFSSGPQHWAEEAQLRHAEGYDVIVAALPGHGFVTRDGREDVSRLPTATQASRYVKFAQGMFDEAHARSDKVHVIGFSVGGAHALEVALAQQHLRGKDGSPVVRSAVAINPYIGPTPTKVGPFHVDLDRAIEVADKLSFGLTAKLLARKRYVFTRAQWDERAGKHDVGFTKVSYTHLLGIGRFGDEVRARAEALPRKLTLPAYVVVSAKDPTANPRLGLAIAKRIGATSLVLPLKVHDPIAKDTNPNSAMRQKVRDTISEALARGR